MGSARAYLILAVFFLTGTLLTPEKFLPSGLRPLAADRQKVVIDGVVLEPPIRPRSGMIRAKVLAQSLISGGDVFPLNENIIVTVYQNAIPLQPGRKSVFPHASEPSRVSKIPGTTTTKNP